MMKAALSFILSLFLLPFYFSLLPSAQRFAFARTVAREWRFIFRRKFSP
jgi:hypothetical protein